MYNTVFKHANRQNNPRKPQTHIEKPTFTNTKPRIPTPFSPLPNAKKAIYVKHFTKFTPYNPKTLTPKQESETDLSAEFNTRFAVRKTENGTFQHHNTDPYRKNAVFS